MVPYITDFAVVILLIIGLTATMGVLSNGIGKKIFAGKRHRENFAQSTNTQTGWKNIGGKE